MENQKHKILIFSTAYKPEIGGAEVAVEQITNRLNDFEFDMITARLRSKLPRREKIGRVNVYRLGWGFPLLDKLCLFFWGQKLAVKLHKKNSYGGIWSIMASYGGFAASSFKNKHPEVPFLLTLQEGDDLSYIRKKTRLVRNKFKKIFSSADYIQAISSYLASWAKEMGARCPISVVPNGISWKTESGYRDAGRTIITTSRLVEKNGLEYLIRAMKEVDGRLLVVGEGKLRKKLERLTAELGLKVKVNFVGQVGHDQIHGYLRQANVFVRPSLSEGLGNSFLEAMADSLPVVATPVGGIPDFLIDGQTGWFCQVKDPASIAEKINYILEPENQAAVRQVVDQARKLVTEKYAWPRLAEAIKNIFNQLLAL